MDVYQELGVEPIINAAGTLTRMSGSIMHPQVVDAMVAASKHFVMMNELHEAAGRRVAELIGVPAAHVCACATAGIAIMAAAVMAGNDPLRARQLPDTDGMADGWVALEAHRNPFDQAVRLVGGRFVGIESDAEKLRQALAGDRIAGVFFTFSWFNTGTTLPLSQVTAIAHEMGKPVIVDAAAEIPPVEHLRRFIDEGADLVTFSGGKALCGPQASGVILGADPVLVAACAVNDGPNMSVGRGMKAGKEEIMGVVKAIEHYLSRAHAADQVLWEERVNVILAALGQIEGVEAWRQMPHGLGQQIPHVAVRWEVAVVGMSYAEVIEELLQGSPRIAVQFINEAVYRFARDTGPQIRLHPHTLAEGEENVVAARLAAVLSTP